VHFAPFRTQVVVPIDGDGTTSADGFISDNGSGCMFYLIEPMQFLRAATSPAWASTVTHTLAAALPSVTVVHGHGHDMVDSAPELVANALRTFLA